MFVNSERSRDSHRGRWAAVAVAAAIVVGSQFWPSNEDSQALPGGNPIATAENPGQTAQQPGQQPPSDIGLNTDLQTCEGQELVAPPENGDLLDIHYCADPEQTMDIYRSETGKPSPVVITVHGGGWRHGDKEDEDWLGKQLSAEGFRSIDIHGLFRIGAVVYVEQVSVFGGRH